MSSDLAKQYHSLTFTLDGWGTKNTWDDWHLVPTSRPLVNPPTQKTNYVDIPGANGSIDLTGAVVRYPVFNDRSGSWEFIVVNDYDSWDEKFSEVADWLFGRNMKVILDDDPGFHYVGRFTLNNWKSNTNGTWSNLTINYTVGPYKLSNETTLDDWLWDPFSFEHGYILPMYFKSIAVDTDTWDENGGFQIKDVHKMVGPMPVVPTVTVTDIQSGTYVQLRTFTSRNRTWSDPVNFYAGTHKNSSFRLDPYTTRIAIKGHAIVSIEFNYGRI